MLCINQTKIISLNSCRRLLIFILVMLLLGTAVTAQQSIDLIFHSGKIVKNYPRFPERTFSLLGSVAYNRKLNGEAIWHQFYHNPEVTFQGTFGSLGNATEFGNIHSISGGYRFIHPLNHKINLTAEARLGAAYFNHPFNEESNIDNVTVGSSITVQATADAGLEYRFSRWSLLAKASVLHCSNSHYSLPNVGINMPLISLGIRYSFGDSLRTSSTFKPSTDKRVRYNFRLALGINEQGGSTGPVNGPHYGVYLASLYINRHYTPVARWQTGLEGYYNQGSYTFITSQRYYREQERLKSSALSAILGHEYIFGHVGFVTQGGIYIYNPLGRDRYEELSEKGIRDYLKTLISARLGLHYYLRSTFDQKRNNLFVGWYTKTNFGKADFMEMTVGYNF